MQFQEFKIENLEQFPKDLENLLEKQLDKIDKITNSNENSYEKILKPLQDLEEELENFFTPLSHLNSVCNSKETQKAYEASLPQLSKFHSKIAQNERLFEKISSLSSSNKEAQKVIDNEIKSFVLSGAKLPLEQKKELEEINLELSELSNRFSQNLLDATNEYELIIEDERAVEGIPATDLALAKIQRDGKDVYRFTLQMPSYIAYMTYGVNRGYREELSRAYATRAPQNAEVIDKILSLRDRKAKLLGFDNYASYSLATKDAPSLDSVTNFLEKLANLSLGRAKAELEEMKKFAKQTDQIGSFRGFDIAYYSEKLKKEKFDFDDSQTQVYFEQNRVLNGLLEVVSELFSVEFKAVNLKVWHKKVKSFDIYKKGNLSGRIYFDLEAREEKRDGAWMHDWETHFVDSKGKKHLPSAFIVCNFAESTPKNPSLLRHSEVVTLFHEMGHGIHHLFGKSSERSVSGINGVAWDVIEFPSQFLENFAYEKAILKRFAFHYKTDKPMSEELLSKIKETKNYQAAMGILRQIEFSLFDFNLHKALYQGDEVQEVLDSVRKKTALLEVPPYNKFQNGFAHIFSGGYAAGYYSYKWAEVLSADAFFSCLDDDGSFNQNKADGYNEFILSRGGSEDMSLLYRQWLGRDAKVESLLRLYGIINDA